MKLTVRVVLGSAVALLACDKVPVAPGNTGRLEVVAVSQASVALDAGKVIVVGPSGNPTTTTRDAAPGQTVTINNLPVGTYSVALQGFVGGEVAMFGQTSGVQVMAGKDTRATVNFDSFVPAADPLPTSATGKTFTVSYAAVTGAVRYQVEAATDQAFTADLVSVDVTPPKKSADITVTNCGTYYARVRAFDPYQSPGRWADAAGSVQVPCPQADLVITTATITVTPTSVVPGGQVSLSEFTVANQGTAASNVFRIGFYLSTDQVITTDDALLFSSTSGVTLAPGASLNVGAALTIPASTAPGTYYIGPLVDDQNGTHESNETNNSKSTALTVLVSPPNAPTQLTAAVVSNTQIRLSWTDNAANETGFSIERCTGTGCTGFLQITTVGPNVRSYLDGPLTSGTSYSYRVRAFNAGGSSGPSNTASSTTSTNLVTCNLGTGGDLISRGFYLPNYQGVSLTNVILYLEGTAAGTYTFLLTARSGAFNGPLIATSIPFVADLSTTAFTIGSFDFSAAPSVVRGSTVAFLLTITSGPSGATAFFDVGNDASCPVVETEDTSPPLSTFRRQGVHTIIRGQP